MTISKLRSWLYFFAKLLGDVNAIKRGRAAERIHNRVVGKLSARLLRKIWK